MVSKKLKFVTAAEGTTTKASSSKSAKIMRSKTISKKPPTKFQEFSLSHSKPKSGGRRAKVEDLLTAGAITSGKDSVNRRLIFGK